MQRLGQAAESRDGDTGEHIQRISRLAHRLALAAGLPEAEAELIGHASAMHDVGKIGIPDRVLLKPGRLDADEWALMQTHTTIGAGILAGSELTAAAARRDDRAHAPRALRRHAATRPGLGRGDPAGGAHLRDLRRLRRPALGAPLQGALDDRGRRSPSSRAQRGRHFDPVLVDAFLAMVPDLEPELLQLADARGDDQGVPGVGVLTLGQSTPAGATERIHSRKHVVAHAGVDAGLAGLRAALAVARRADDLQRAGGVAAEHRAAGVALAGVGAALRVAGADHRRRRRSRCRRRRSRRRS